MKRKKNACFKKQKQTKKKNPKLYCCVMYRTGKKKKQLYYSGLCLHYPGHIVKPSLSRKKRRKKCNERLNSAKRDETKKKNETQNGLKLVAQCLHLASLQVFHNQSLYSGNLECMSIQISAAWQSRTDSLSSIPGFFLHSQTNHSFLFQSPSLRLGLAIAKPQRVKKKKRLEKLVGDPPSWLPSPTGGGITVWTTHTVTDGIIIMAVCVCVYWWKHAGQRLGRRRPSVCPFKKKKKKAWRRCVIGSPEPRWQWTRSGRVCSTRHVKIQSNWSVWFRCRLEVWLYKHFFFFFSELQMIFCWTSVFRSQRSSLKCAT